MICGKCLVKFDSYLQMEMHKSQAHGEKNQMSQFNSVKEFQGGSANRQEKELNADEKLHEAIDRWKHKR